VTRIPRLARLAELIAVVAVSTAAMLIATATAYADAVTASECKHGNGVVHTMPHFPYICVGGRWDGAEVWSRP
jgi:hypothetical protein